MRFPSLIRPLRSGVTAALTAGTLLGLGAAARPAAAAAAGPASFSQLFVFGDSLSDVGNIASRSGDEFVGIRYPGTAADYADGRFTDSKDTSPAARNFQGVWHEQLAEDFLGLKPATPSLEGGTDYAFGGATTEDGTSRRVIIHDPIFGADLTFTIDNMGKQVNDFLNKVNSNADPNALYVVWGGANDLLNDPSDANVAATSQRVGNLITRLAQAGARYFLVPNVPPLGVTPDHSGDAAQAAALTGAAASYADQLNAVLDQTTANFAAGPNPVTIYRLDVFGIFGRLANDAIGYGFKNISQSSRDQGVNPDRFLFWDGLHPTTAGHFQLGAEAYTVLTGVPVLEIFPDVMNISEAKQQMGLFWVTRTGDDLSSELTVPYQVDGNARAGVDFQPLKGTKLVRAGRRSVQIGVHPLVNPNNQNRVTLRVTLEPSDFWALSSGVTGAPNAIIYLNRN